jgi:hypothetical protein
VSGDFGPLSELVYDLGNIVELDTRYSSWEIDVFMEKNIYR